MPLPTPKRSLPPLIGCLGLVACTGTVENIPGASPEESRPVGDNATGGVGGTSYGGPSPDTGLRRLSRTEYGNTLRDALYLSAAPQSANALVPDGLVNGFDNNAALLGGSVIEVNSYDTIAADGVAAAFRSTSSRAKLAPCDLSASGCARMVLSTFAHRAWRRPVADDEVDGLMKALDVARAQGDPVDEGMKLALRGILVSPSFLYRVESDPPDARGLHRITPHELATRLSYFIWSSMPDDELLARADDGSLGTPKVFAAQLARLLDHAKADALIANFAGQWLGTRAVATFTPDPKIFNVAAFDEPLRKAMVAETQAFFDEFRKSGRNIADMLETDFTYVNDRLARHYKLPAVAGSVMQKISIDGATTHRFGLLSQASILMATSNPNRTNVPKRGKWVLERLLCSPPPPPPANVPALSEDPKSTTGGTIRDRLKAHLTQAACVGCHQLTDPIGFGLEHYDPIGRWRESYGSAAIDAAGTLPGGVPFDGAWDMSRKLKQDRRLHRCFAKTLFEYAFGRDSGASGDSAAIDALTAGFSRESGRIEALVALIASSQAFQNRGGLP